MSEEIRLRTAAGLSSLWDGAPIKRVRGGDGVLYLKGRRLSLHLMVQPGVAEGLLADPMLSKQGLLGRLLVSSPSSLAGTRMQRPVKAAADSALKSYDKRVIQLLRHRQRRAVPSNPELSPRPVSLSSEARTLWIEFADECECKLREEGQFAQITAFANKLQEHALRIATVFEIMDDLDAPNVSAQAMGRGIIIARYYAEEALRLLAQDSSSPEILRAEKVLVSDSKLCVGVS